MALGGVPLGSHDLMTVSGFLKFFPGEPKIIIPTLIPFFPVFSLKLEVGTAWLIWRFSSTTDLSTLSESSC